MFGKWTVVISVLVLALMCAGGATAEGTGASPTAGVLAPIGTAFTYQGQLQSGGAPVNADCDFQFSLWDAAGSGTPPSGGNQVGSQAAPNIPVTNGLFAARLDFGSDAFRGEARWLQTAVRCPAGSGTYTTLAPRQALTPVPYAMFSQDLALPFDKWTDSPLNAFKVRNAGAGPAGVFEIDNPANDNAALKAHGRGTGAALGAWAWNDSDAFWANVYGTGDVAHLSTDNPDNAGTVVSASTKGTGRAGSFRIDNALNTQPALSVSTNGSGNAGAFNTSGSGSAVSAWTYGSGPALSSVNAGSGDVAWLSIDNANNPGSVINARTKGTGLGASIRIENTLNTHSAFRSETNGSGNAGSFTTSGSGSAVSAWTSGSGTTLSAVNAGTGDAAWLSIDNANNPGSVINARTEGTGMGASIRIENTLNSQPALYASTDGSGNAVHVNAYGSGNAIAAWSFGSGWAASFANEGSGNGIEVSVPQGKVGLSSNGSKNAVVGTSDGARLLYTEESTEVWFSDYGFGRLTNGSAFIAVDPIFSETVSLAKPYHVFVQPYGDAELYVSQRTPQGFEVRLRAGDPGVEFSYRLAAVRRGYEETRLERAPWADDDPNLYPAQPAAPGQGGAR
jgi:hypothetical protein